SHVHTEILGLSIRSEAIQLVTKIGCPHSCDFCVTNKLFNNKYSGSYFTPRQVHDAILEHARKIKKPFKIGFSEPTAIISRDWWYELFHLFEDDDGDYPVIIATTASSLNGFDFKKVMDSALRIEMVNIGVESFSTTYGKNKNLDLKALIKHLGNHGISSYATYIIGFDHQTHDSVWDEIRQLVDLDAAAFNVFNLKPFPRTPIWDLLSKANRLLAVPWDFYSIHGFQPFLHPHFKPGFEDMLPLIIDINAFIERERGMQGLDIAEVLEHVQHKHILIQKQVKTYKMIGRVLFNSWKRHLQPSDEQIASYKQKAGMTRKKSDKPSVLEAVLRNRFTRLILNSYGHVQALTTK
nr:hypothetical protein [Candidatus Sigynarchaeota archaeon]